MLQELDIDLDLKAVFNLKKIPTYSRDIRSIKTHLGIKNITEDLKHFQYDEFKARLKFIKSDWLKFI